MFMNDWSMMFCVFSAKVSVSFGFILLKISFAFQLAALAKSLQESAKEKSELLAKKEVRQPFL